ncbi:MAG: hypothetical protein M3273_03600 [Actinomycetota bacterium]|nr:hypothetical protein [Actinomycetota bacterium]
MRRAVLGVIVLLAGSIASAPAEGHPGHERPKITVMRWKDPPVTIGSGECDEQGVCDEEIIVIKAHDPDSSITEVQVWFDEDGEGAPFVYAHTFCVQGKEPGTPARLEIGAAFEESGDYTVAAVAYSHKGCKAHEKGDGHAFLHSRVKRLETTVEAPE